MAYPQPFIRIVASGTMLTGAEIWSTSWSMADPDLSNDAEQPSALNVIAMADAVRDWFVSPGARISNSALLDRVKINLVGTNGRYVSQTDTFEREFEPAVAGNKASGLWPPQCSVAVSLRSNKRRGPGAFGRFYPPLTVGDVQADGRIPAGQAGDMAQAAASLLRDLNLSAGLTLQVVNASSVGAGTFQKVTSVRVGRVVDTIRRRNNALVEDYQEESVLTLPGGP